jgi:hypothetical protein
MKSEMFGKTYLHFDDLLINEFTFVFLQNGLFVKNPKISLKRSQTWFKVHAEVCPTKDTTSLLRKLGCHYSSTGRPYFDTGHTNHRKCLIYRPFYLPFF